MDMMALVIVNQMLCIGVHRRRFKSGGRDAMARHGGDSKRTHQGLLLLGAEERGGDEDLRGVWEAMCLGIGKELGQGAHCFGGHIIGVFGATS